MPSFLIFIVSCIANIFAQYNQQDATFQNLCISVRRSTSYVYWAVHNLDSWIKRDELDVTCFVISLFNAQHVSDVNTSETCWALNNEIIKASDIKLVSLYSTLYMFQTVFLSITRSSKLHIQPQVFVRQILLPAARRKNRIKHAQFLTEINKLWNVASYWLYSENTMRSIKSFNILQFMKWEVWSYKAIDIETLHYHDNININFKYSWWWALAPETCRVTLQK